MGRESILVVVDVRFISIFLSKLIFLFQAQLENTLQGKERRWIIAKLSSDFKSNFSLKLT